MLVTTIRRLRGEDVGLKAAYDRFSKALQQEHNVVKLATLAGVQQVDQKIDEVYSDMTRGFGIWQSVRRDTQALLVQSAKLDRMFTGKIGITVPVTERILR
jgi:hypothetical protein